MFVPCDDGSGEAYRLAYVSLFIALTWFLKDALCSSLRC
jgi:hypothetical protein